MKPTYTPPHATYSCHFFTDPPRLWASCELSDPLPWLCSLSSSPPGWWLIILLQGTWARWAACRQKWVLRGSDQSQHPWDFNAVNLGCDLENWYFQFPWWLSLSASSAKTVVVVMWTLLPALFTASLGIQCHRPQTLPSVHIRSVQNSLSLAGI